MIDVFHKEGVTSDVGSGRQLLVAASILVTQCAQHGEHHEGGYLRDLGRAHLLSTRANTNPVFAFLIVV